jgi:hypothetical protein
VPPTTCSVALSCTFERAPSRVQQAPPATVARAKEWRSTYMRERFYSWLDPSFALDVGRGEIGIMVYLRDPARDVPSERGHHPPAVRGRRVVFGKREAPHVELCDAPLCEPPVRRAGLAHGLSEGADPDEAGDCGGEPDLLDDPSPVGAVRLQRWKSGSLFTDDRPCHRVAGHFDLVRHEIEPEVVPEGDVHTADDCSPSQIHGETLRPRLARHVEPVRRLQRTVEHVVTGGHRLEYPPAVSIELRWFRLIGLRRGQAHEQQTRGDRNEWDPAGLQLGGNRLATRLVALD